LTFWSSDNRDNVTARRLSSLAEQEAKSFVVYQLDPAA